MNQEFDRAVSEIRNEAIADAEVEAAAARVWDRLRHASLAGSEVGGLGSGMAGYAGSDTASQAFPDPEAAPPEPAPHIADCAAFQGLIPDLRANRLDADRATLLRDHLHECVACRRVYEGRVVVMPHAAAAQRPRFPYKFAAAAAIVAAAGVSIWIAYEQFGHSGRALVQSVNGSLFAISSGGIHPLRAGAALPDGVEIRTAKDSTAMLELRDGSMVEMRERSALTADQGVRDISLRLERGSVIVQAAHRASGHLFVATADCRVAVTGTIFGVTAGAKGSRVSVVQGEVHVDRETRQNIVHPGSQIVTGSDLEAETVREDLAWSRNHARYDAILAALGQALSQIPQPELRYESHLLGRLPANVMFYASIPNLGAYLGEAEDIFRKKTAQSPALDAWWQAHGGSTASTIERLRAASEYLGGEIAIAALPNSDGPAFLAEVKRPGFAEFLKRAGFPAGATPAELERNGLVLFGAPRAVEQLSGVLDSPDGAIQATDFYHHVEDAYRRGVGFLVCANLANMAAAGTPSHPDGKAPIPANAQALIFDATQVHGAMENRISLDFNGPRTGIAAWLASPSPIGSLDYISPEASAAAAAVVANGSALVEQLKSIAPKELGAVTGALGAGLGGEFAIAVDGPIMPVPSWKLVAEVYDPAAAQAALQQAAASYSNDAANAGQKPLAIAQETFEGRTFYSVTVPGGGPLLEFHYTFADGYLIAGPSRGVVARALQIKNSGNSLLHASKITAMMPRDHHADFSLVFYENLGPAVAPLADLLGGMIPQRPGEKGAPGAMAGSQLGAGSLKPSLIAAYAEPERITFAANGDLLGPALASLMRGDFAGAAGSAIPFFQPQGTRKHEMSYR